MDADAIVCEHVVAALAMMALRRPKNGTLIVEGRNGGALVVHAMGRHPRHAPLQRAGPASAARRLRDLYVPLRRPARGRQTRRGAFSRRVVSPTSRPALESSERRAGQGALALRNFVARSPEFTQPLLDAGAEHALRQAAGTSQANVDVAYRPPASEMLRLRRRRRPVPR